MVYDTLLAMDENLVVRPQMLEGWKISDDKLTYTFTLRDGLKFHGGAPVTSADCIASLQRWAPKDAMGQKLFSLVKELKPVDDKSFTMVLSEPYGLVLESLGKLIGRSWKRPDAVERHSRAFRCRCGNHIFFRNTLCLKCQSPLGYLPLEARLVPLDPGPDPDTWRVPDRDALYKCCSNRELPAHCNWLQAFEVGIDPVHPSFLHRFLNDAPLDDIGENAAGKQFRTASAGDFGG